MIELNKKTNSPVAVLGAEYGSLFEKALTDEGFYVILLPAQVSLMPVLSYHTDMIITAVQDTLVVSNEYYVNNREQINEIVYMTDQKLCISSSVPGYKYPSDVCFNVFLCGQYCFGNPNAVSPDIIKLLEHYDLQFVPVKQGYAACSVCVIGESNQAIITADLGIYKAALSCKIDTLLISPCKEIILPGLDYGFIGGCSGYYNGVLYTTGDLTLHPDYKKIYDFCSKYAVKIKILGQQGNSLFDIGGIKMFPPGKRISNHA